MTVLIACCALIASSDVETRAAVSSSMRGGQLASLTDAQSEPGLEAVVSPRIELELDDRLRMTRFQLSGRFSTLRLQSQEQSFASGALSLSHDRPLGRTLELNTTARVTGGTQDFRQAFTTLDAPPAEGAEPLPPSANATQLDSFVLRFINARAALGATKRFDARRALTLSAETRYADGEGDDESVLGRFPRERTLLLQTSYDHRLTRLQQLTVGMDLSQSEFEIVGTYRLATLDVAWTRRTQRGEIGFEAGGLMIQTELEEELRLVPNANFRGTAQLWSSGERRVRAGLETGFVTNFDRFSARLLPRANLALVVTAVFNNEWQWISTGSFQAPIGDGIGGLDALPLDTTLAAQSTVDWTLDDEVALSAGLTWFVRAAPLDEPFEIRQQEITGTVGLNVGYTL